MKVQTKKELTLKGTPISGGVAIGTPFFFHLHDESIPEERISKGQVEIEIKRYRMALEGSRGDLTTLLERMESENAMEVATILDAHLQMMKDPLLTSDVEEYIVRECYSASYAFQTLVEKYVGKFQSMKDRFFRERVRDLQDIARRVMSHLCATKRGSLADIPKGSIVFAKDLTASVIAEVEKEQMSGLVTSGGSSVSHAAIIAKAKEIPYVANVNYAKFEEKVDGPLVVHGGRGDVIIHPTEKRLQAYRSYQKKLASYIKKLENLGALDAITTDGRPLHVSGNIEMASELERLHKFGGAGVGLFRSEFFLSKQGFPSEEEQYQIYLRVVKRMRGLPLVIRTFDVGGDKLTEEQQVAEQRGNPYLGCRAIRFLLKERTIFKAQLRAILRASAYGKVRVLFPMITSLPELLQAKEILHEAKVELLAEKKRVAVSIPVGCMIEVPGAAMIADILANECDFLSIGTNDLIQYSLAADRTNQDVSVLYSPAHPSVLRLIQTVVSHARKYKTPVTVCGEMAADPKFTPLLIGLGVEEFSVATRWIALIKNVIRQYSLEQAESITKKALTLKTAEEVELLLQASCQKFVPSDLFPPE